MKLATFIAGCALAVLGSLGGAIAHSETATQLDLKGYGDDSGVISVLHGGASFDPYFTMQALLLAQENGLDISVAAEKFVNWLLPRQKPDGTFDRFCRNPDKTWMACKAADADDSLLAIWMKLLETMPVKLKQNAAWTKSYQMSKVSLERLFQPSRGIYMVSHLYMHGLFMDNLEVWSLKMHMKKPKELAEANKLAKSIHDTFWEPVNKHFLVSTQLEQRSETPSFYPDHVAQIFPLLVNFPLLPADEKIYYRQWMGKHRSDWLNQGKADYPWGLIAVLALRQNDTVSARCWMRESQGLRHSSRWAVTDEVSWQILASKRLTPAAKEVSCK